jgi:hypothetical protein
MLFVSAVDAQMLGSLCNKKNDAVIKTIFPIWWPFGRNLMAPLSLASTFAHAAAYAATEQPKWAIASVLVFSTIVWTVTAMNEAITELRASDSNQVLVSTRRFCAMHHLRLLVSCSAYAMVLFA